STDALLAGISNAAAAPVADMVLPVTAVSNLLLNIVLAVVLTIAGGLVIDKVLEPRLNRAGVGVNSMVSEDANTEVTAAEKSALRWAGLALLAVVGLVLALSIPGGAPLRNEA